VASPKALNLHGHLTRDVRESPASGFLPTTAFAVPGENLFIEDNLEFMGYDTMFSLQNIYSASRFSSASMGYWRDDDTCCPCLC